MNILNQIKKVFKKEKLTSVQTLEAGVFEMGRVIDDHPSNFITPGKMKAIFEDAENGQIKEQHELFMDIEERDGAILANLQTRKRAALGLDWAICAPRNATDKENKLRDEVEELFYQFSNLEDLIVDCMDAVGHGFSAMEIEWKFNGTHWIPNRFIHRSPSWFALDKKDNLLLRTPGNPMGEPLQQFSWLVHYHKSRSSALARNGLFRSLAWLYMFKHYSVHDFAEFLELYGMPIRIGKYGAGATKEERQVLLRALAGIGHNAAGIMPDSMQVELHNAANASSSSNPFLQMTDWCEKSIARLILGQTLTSGADGKSSTNALGNVHNEVRRDLLVSDVKQLAQTFTKQIILPYLVINFPDIDPERIPYFQFDTKETEDLSLFADSLPKLVSVGMKIPESWARDKLGIPEVDDENDILKAVQSGFKADLNGSQNALSSVVESHSLGCACGCSSHLPAKDSAQSVLDESLDNAYENVDFNKQLEPMVKQFVNVLMACSSYEEASEKLVELYPDLNSNKHHQYLTTAIFLSELLGDVENE